MKKIMKKDFWVALGRYLFFTLFVLMLGCILFYLGMKEKGSLKMGQKTSFFRDN